MACNGWPPVSAAPGAQGSAAEVTGCQCGRLLTGPLNSWPPGANRYPRLPVRTSCAEAGAPPLAPRPITPATGVHASWPAGLEYREKLVQPAAKSAPVPAQRAQIANATPLTVSRPVTRIPWVGIRCQVRPLSWVAYNCGPNAHPWTPSSDLTWLTPVPPSGGPVTGAGMPCQIWPASSVRASEVQMLGSGGPQWPGVPTWPMTHPVDWETNVTEEAAKFGGTRSDVGEGVGVAEPSSDPAVPEDDGLAGLGELCCAGVVELDSATGAPPTCPGSTSRGTMIAPAATTAAPATARVACPSLRRRARFLTCSKVPGRGSKGVTRSSSQVSMSSRGSSMSFPQHCAEPGACVVQVGLDRALRPPEHLRDVPDREPGVVVQQERLA